MARYRLTNDGLIEWKCLNYETNVRLFIKRFSKYHASVKLNGSPWTSRREWFLSDYYLARRNKKIAYFYLKITKSKLYQRTYRLLLCSNKLLALLRFVCCNDNAPGDIIQDKHEQINWEVLERSFSVLRAAHAHIKFCELKTFISYTRTCLPLSITSVPGAPGPSWRNYTTRQKRWEQKLTWHIRNIYKARRYINIIM